MELNRCPTFLCEEIVAAGAQNEVAVAIVENCSSDQTRAIADRHVDRTPWCRYFRHGAPRCENAQEYGLTTSMAFILRYVFRRQQHLSFAGYILVSRIYSHVFGLARKWRGKQVLAVNHPLVVRLCDNGALRE